MAQVWPRGGSGGEAALHSPPPETDEGTKSVDAAPRWARRERTTLLAGSLPPVSQGRKIQDLAAWRCHGGPAGRSLALDCANGGACSIGSVAASSGARPSMFARSPVCYTCDHSVQHASRCSVTALLQQQLVAVMPVNGGGVAHIILGAAPFLYLGVTWCVGVVLLRLWVRLVLSLARP
jgi:hypothetical protein